MKKFDYIIKGAYGTGNFGDDALFDVIYSNLPENSKVAVIAKDSKYLESNYPGVVVFNPTDNYRITSDYFVYGGGTQFYSFNKTQSVLFKIKYHIFHPTYIPKKVFGKVLKVSARKTIGIGLGLGPFHDKKNNRYLNAIKTLNQFDELFVRDCKSLCFCKDNNIKAKLNTDLCFSKKYEVSKERENVKGAVILRDWDHDNHGKKHYKPILNYIIENRDSYKVILFAKDEYWMKVLNDNGIDLIVWDPLKYSISEFVNILDAFDYYISSRFHGLIYATLLGKPSISIEVEPKLTIGAELNCGLIWGGDFSKTQLEKLVSKLKSNYSEYRELCIEKKEEKYKESSDLFYFIGGE